jgi:hypothetical protein
VYSLEFIIEARLKHEVEAYGTTYIYLPCNSHATAKGDYTAGKAY